MKIQNIYPKFLSYKNPNCIKPSFNGAKDINLSYVYSNRLHILPEKMKAVIKAELKNPKNSKSLMDMHLATYAKLNDCRNLDEVRNLYPEFGEVLSAENVIKHRSVNIKKIEKVIPLSDLSIYILKERWGKLKTFDEIAKSLGLENRNSLAWFVDKLRIPEFNKNYVVLLRASDEAGNNLIAQKTKDYNKLHRQEIVEKNRRVSAMTVDIQREITQEAWNRLPHVKAALSDMAKQYDKKILMSAFWSRYPEYAKEYGEMKSIVAKELKFSRKKS